MKCQNCRITGLQKGTYFLQFCHPAILQLFDLLQSRNSAILPFMKRTLHLRDRPGCPHDHGRGAGARPREDCRSVQVESRRHLSERRGLARRQEERLQAALQDLRQFQGKLSSSPATLADALDKLFALDKELSRATSTQAMLADQDTRDRHTRACGRRWCSSPPHLAREAAYIEPEILRFPEGTVDALPRRRAAAEDLLVLSRRTSPAARRTRSARTRRRSWRIAGPLWPDRRRASFNILSNADFPYPTVTLSDGKTVKLDQAGFTPAARRCRIAPIARR